MPRDEVDFRGRDYTLRLIDFGKEWGDYFVGSMHLQALLFDEEKGYTCQEARHVDEMIFYFIPPHYFKLSDDDLRDKILDEIV